MRDVTFYSKALQRNMPYRIVMPTDNVSGKKLGAVYLLHGGGGNLRDWTNYSDVAKYAEHGLILVMPEGNSSYYANAAGREFHTTPGDHNWKQWDKWVPELFRSLEEHLMAASKTA